MWKQLVLWVVDGHTPLDELEQLRRLVHAWYVDQGDAKNVTLVVIHGTNTTMNADERRAVARMIDETKSSRVASATVVLGDGMVGALHRSILTGFSFLVPPPHPVKIFARVEPAVVFLHPFIEALCGPVSPDHVGAMVDDLHREMRGRSS
jgi:hypothetical protein